MIQFLRRLFGFACCQEFTQWEDREAEFSRSPHDMLEKVRAGFVDRITFTRRWQERCCTICGKVQQRELRY
jgi:hypothetical protein